jgi:diketogulonate reductase-like aldo/keto reductase
VYAKVKGVEVPRLGFGTWLLYGQAAAEAVCDALELGYRHVDTAWLYENEWWVGAGIRDSGVPREELFLTTKVYANAFWTASPRKDRAVGGDGFRWGIEHSLLKLDTDYLDLVLLHWPSADVPLEETLDGMAALKEEGYVRQIGVSNFPAGMLRRACELAPVFSNQVEYHPFLSQDRLLATAQELDVLVIAHSPLAAGRVFQDETLARIASRHGKTPSQVALRWLVEQPGVAAIPTATTHDWRVENLGIFDFELSEQDRAEVAALPKDVRLVDGEIAPDWND